MVSQKAAGRRGARKVQLVGTLCLSPASMRGDLLYLFMYVFGKKGLAVFFFFKFRNYHNVK